MKQVLLVGGVGLLAYLAWQQYQKNKAGCGCKGLTDVTVVKDKLAPTSQPAMVDPALTQTPANMQPPIAMQQAPVNPVMTGVGYNHSDLLSVL